MYMFDVVRLVWKWDRGIGCVDLVMVVIGGGVIGVYVVSCFFVFGDYDSMSVCYFVCYLVDVYLS